MPPHVRGWILFPQTVTIFTLAVILCAAISTKVPADVYPARIVPGGHQQIIAGVGEHFGFPSVAHSMAEMTHS